MNVRTSFLALIGLTLVSCSATESVQPTQQYTPDPWLKIEARVDGIKMFTRGNGAEIPHESFALFIDRDSLPHADTMVFFYHHKNGKGPPYDASTEDTIYTARVLLSHDSSSIRALSLGSVAKKTYRHFGDEHSWTIAFHNLPIELNNGIMQLVLPLESGMVDSARVSAYGWQEGSGGGWIYQADSVGYSPDASIRVILSH